MEREQGVVSVSTRAIDVGYFNVKGTLGQSSTDEISCFCFPALAPQINQDKQLTSSGTSDGDGCLVKIDGITYFVGKDVVLNSSGHESRPVMDDYSVSAKYLALLRGALHYMAVDAGATKELTIDHLVLGLPLNTYKVYKDQLHARATGEHLIGPAKGSPGVRRVIVKNVHIIVQPQGAMVNCGLQSTSANDGWTLVVDPGGGTLDWFVTIGKTPNWQRSGAYPRSMLACAYAVADMINPKWRNQFELVERIDKAIRTKAVSFRAAGKEYRMENYQYAVDQVLEDAIKNMLQSVGPTDNLDTIIFTGGGAAVFYDYFTRHYPELVSRIVIDKDPVYSNVRGFHIVGEYLNHSHGV